MGLKLHNSTFREKIIEYAIAGGDYDKAIALAKEGIILDKTHAPGLVYNWNIYLLTAYEKTGNKQELTRLARTLFLKDSWGEARKDHYQLLKKQIPAQEWSSYVEGLIKEVKTKCGADYYLLAYIYIDEQRWKDLLQIVYDWPSFDRIREAEKYLFNIYPLQLAGMYRECILADMEHVSDRNHYRQVFEYIRRMIKLGAEEEAVELAEQLKKLYPRRRAMIEELAEVLKQ